MSKVTKFKADALKLEQAFFLISGALVVPRFQRPYKWGAQYITELWNDLNESIGRNDDLFLGSFIYNYESVDDDKCIYIIDGQQRLLTITILSAAIKDHYTKLGDNKSADTTYRHDIVFEDFQGNPSLRIHPTDSLMSFYEACFKNKESDIYNAKGNTIEENLVVDNYKYFFDKIGEQLNQLANIEDKIARLNDFRSKIRNIDVIKIDIYNEDVAYEIFESTNARGLELSVADLLKNLILKKIRPDSGKDVAKELWQDITTNIEYTGIDLRKYIRYYWLSKYSFITEKKLFKAIKDNINDWNQFLNNLTESSFDFNTLITGNEDGLDKFKHPSLISELLNALNIMGVTQCYVFLLAVLRNIDKLGTNPENVFVLIEKFTFMYSGISSLPPNRIERIYSKYATLLEDKIATSKSKRIAVEVQKVIAGLENELKEFKPSKSIFVEKFKFIELGKTEESRKFIKYILLKIEANYSSTKEKVPNMSMLTTEHILPEKPDPEWKLSQRQIKKYVNKIGNLTLLGKYPNSEAQNFTIPIKIPYYLNSEYYMTQELGRKFKIDPTWDEAKINERQDELAAIAYDKIWKY